MINIQFLFKIFFVLVSVSALSPALVIAQKISSLDTAYILTYPDKITTRVYMSQKYSHFKVPAKSDQNDLEYRANSKLNIGVGATYKNLTLNVSYGLPGTAEKGKTKGIDFQSYIISPKWIVDAFASFHKGNYLHPRGYGSSQPNGYYYRPDVKINMIALAAYRVANGQKFSYRASLLQNEWQIKSAGSLLYGGEIAYTAVKGDSAVIPVNIENSFFQSGVNNLQFISVSPGIGYAYTLVIDKHFFITGSVVGNLAVNFLTEKRTNEAEKKNSVSPLAVYKGAIGYNSGTWSLAATIAGNRLWLPGKLSPKNYTYNIGNFRLMLAKKIGVNQTGSILSRIKGAP